MKTKRILAGLLSFTMIASITGCSTKEKTDDNAGTTKAADNNTAADTTAAPADTTKSEETLAASGGDVNLSFSWWGGDSRHEATMNAVAKFTELNPNIKVANEYGAWTGWEDAMATKFYAGTAPDVNQINWNWITSFSSDGSAFLDLNKVSNALDLTQFSKSSLESCTLAGELQAVPVSLTGRIFYWNKATFDKAGIAVPTSYAELLAAGQTFKDVLGDDYYPLVVGEYDRMILMVYYLESVYGKNWVENNQLNYSTEEIAEGLKFIKELEDNHVTPSIMQITGDGAESLDKNPKWMEGKYAGIFEWDSSATKFSKALNEGQDFVVGNYFADFGTTKGGFSKVSLAMAITENTKYPVESAMLINFLLNEEEGAKLMASERGIPLSAAGLKVCKDNDLLDPLVAEANARVLAWVSFNLDPKFEDAGLKSLNTGTYYDAMAGLSYGDYDLNKAAEVLKTGVEKVLNS